MEGKKKWRHGKERKKERVEKKERGTYEKEMKGTDRTHRERKGVAATKTTKRVCLSMSDDVRKITKQVFFFEQEHVGHRTDGHRKT